MTWKEFLAEQKTALIIAGTVVLCALSFGMGTNYSHVTPDNGCSQYHSIPNPCDPDSNN